MTLRATSLYPFFSKRVTTSPINPRWTASGLSIMKERSLEEESEWANLVDAASATAAARKVKEWLVEVVVVVSLVRVAAAEAKVERPAEDAQAAPGVIGESGCY